MDQKATFVVIESEILFDHRLTAEEKILYSIISALSCRDKPCYASNNYFSSKLNKSNRQIQRYLRSLEKLNYITINREGNKRIIKSTIEEFISKRANENKNIELIDYNWLNEED